MLLANSGECNREGVKQASVHKGPSKISRLERDFSVSYLTKGKYHKMVLPASHGLFRTVNLKNSLAGVYVHFGRLRGS